MVGCGSFNANAEIICPPRESYEPCGCSVDDAGDGTTVSLSCSFNFLGDVRVSEILDVFLTSPSVSPVSKMSLNRNLLTRVPLQISQFTHLETVLLDQNFIISIPYNAFNFTRPPRYLWLNNNRINAFEAGAFQGNAKIILIKCLKLKPYRCFDIRQLCQEPFIYFLVR